MTVFKLTRFELKKLFARKSFIILFAVMFVVGLVNVARYYERYHSGDKLMNDGRYRIYSVFKGELTEEKQKDIEKLYNYAIKLKNSGNFDNEYNPEKYYSGYAYGEANLFIELYSEMNRILSYGDDIIRIGNEAKELIENNSGMNGYLVSLNNMISDTYSDRELSALSHNSGISEFLDYKFSVILIAMLLIIGVSSIFMADKNYGCRAYIKTSLYGSATTTLAKLSATAFYVFSVLFIFFITDFICFCGFLNIDGLDKPLYYLADYFYSPIELDIWQVLIIVFFCRYIGLLCLSFMIALITRLLQRSVPSFLLSVFLFAGFMYLMLICTTDSSKLIRMQNPLNLILCHNSFKEFDVINIGGTPVLSCFVSAVAVLFLCLLSVILIILPDISHISFKKRGDRYDKAGAV